MNTLCAIIDLVFVPSISTMTFLKNYTDQDSDLVYKTIKEEYSWFTMLSCTYPDLRPILPRVLSIAQFVIFIILVITNTIALGITLYLSSDDPTIAMQTLHFIVMNTIAITILLTYNSQRLRFSRFHNDIGEKKQTYDIETENAIDDFRVDLQKKRKMFNVAVPLFIGTGGLLIVCLNPISDYLTGNLGKRVYSKNGVSLNLAIPCWSPFGSDNFLNYLLSISLQAGDHFVIVTTIVTANVIMFVMTRHVLTEVNLLITALRRLHQRASHLYKKKYGKPYIRDSNDEDQHTTSLYHQCYNECLKENVKHHQRILRIFDDMNNTWTGIFLIFFFTSTFSIAMSGILLMFGDGKVTTIINAISMGVTEIFDVLYICSCGKLMSEANDNLYLCLYETQWYNGTKESARMLLIIMSKAKQPLVLYFNSITKLPADLETFSNLMNTAYSYFNLLYAFRNES